MLLVYEIRKKHKKNYVFLFFFGLTLFYIYWQSISIYGGDAGDLVSAAFVFGVPHPPGYPTYTFLAWLVSRVPIGTVAWRIAFLSSIPSVISSYLIYKILKKIIKVKFFSLLASCIFAFVYPIYLYSQVPEVFLLYLLFVLLLIYTLLLYREKFQTHFLYIFSFIFGLSLTHHHLIVFLLPSFLFLIVYKNKKKKQLTKVGFLFKTILFFLIPLSLYSYSFFAAKTNPPLNWENPVNFVNLKKLATRESYGTFTSTRSAAYQSTLPRLLGVFVLFQFIYDDFGIFGILFAFLGLYYLYKRKKEFFYFIAISLLILVFFVFYAAFPLTIDFNVATFERFVTTPYLFIIFTISSGMVFFYQMVTKLSKRFSNNKLKTILLFGVKISFVFYAVSFLLINFPKISILKNDTTAENLALDILTPLEKNAILILADDTPLFNTQYVYYTQKARNDVILVHHSKLFAPYYLRTLKKYYPGLKLTKSKKGHESTYEFIANNQKNHPIYLNTKIVLKKGRLLPVGVLYRYYPEDKIPKADEIRKISESFWRKYQDPLKGSLGTYQNLMLADVLRVYSYAHTDNAHYYLDNKLDNLAKSHFKAAIRLQPQKADNYYFLGKIYFYEKKCQAALTNIEKANELDPDHLDTYFLLKETYANCLNDPAKAKYYKNLYQQKRRVQEGLLEEL